MSALSRLNKARKSAADYTANHPEAKHYHDWRHWVTRNVKARHVWRDPNFMGLVYCDDLETLGWRVVGAAHEVNSWIKETGWYSDSYQSATYIGMVLQLPARNGIEQYVPAIRHSDWDTATVYLNDVTPEKRDAANWANQNAEREAESSREADAKDCAEQRIAEARAEIHRINKILLPNFKAMRTAVLGEFFCGLVKVGIESYMADRREAFATIKKLEDDFWRAVPQ